MFVKFKRLLVLRSSLLMAFPKQINTGVHSTIQNSTIDIRNSPSNPRSLEPRVQPTDRSTAGVIVIGDEILKGRTLDTNSHFLCKSLFDLGVTVERISVIGDDVEVISQEVSQFSSRFKYVITTGGIGPTHDDKTHLGVARAFGESVKPHPGIVEMARKVFKREELTPAETKLCEVAESAVVHHLRHPKANFPLVSVRNVYVFPGVPFLLERVFESAKHLFTNESITFLTKTVYVNLDELKIAHILSDLSNRFHKSVVIGSYPNFFNSYYKVKVTLDADNCDHLSAAETLLLESLPAGSIVAYDDDQVSSAVERVYSLCKSSPGIEESFRTNVQEAVSICEEALRRYSPNEIALSFNGGKDCTALLHLFYAVLKRQHPDSRGIQTLYIRGPSPFPELEDFIKSSQRRYNLDLTQLDGCIKESLSTFKTMKPDIKAIIMGTRCTDPYSGNLEAFSPTDADWPQYMRVNPLLRWKYQDVWSFLRSLFIPYCQLYDRGYTSLGSMTDTHRNRWLRYVDADGKEGYFPAYKLSLDAAERHGRL